MSVDQKARAAHLIRGRLAIIRAEQQHLFELLRLSDHDIEQTQKMAGEINQLEFEAKSREAELKTLEQS